MFCQNFSFFQLHKKKTSLVHGGWNQPVFSPGTDELILWPNSIFLGSLKQRNSYFSSQSTVFLQQQWKWDHSSLTWPFYKALYKPVILWWQHCPWKKERQADVDANMEWLGHKHMALEKIAYLKAPPQQSGQLFYYMPKERSFLPEIYKTILKKQFVPKTCAFKKIWTVLSNSLKFWCIIYVYTYIHTHTKKGCMFVYI